MTDLIRVYKSPLFFSLAGNLAKTQAWKMFHLHFSLRIFLYWGKERKMPATCFWNSALVKTTQRNSGVWDNIHSLLRTHTYIECKVIQRHVVRAANRLQLSVVPVLDSRVRDALTWAHVWQVCVRLKVQDPDMGCQSKPAHLPAETCQFSHSYKGTNMR